MLGFGFARTMETAWITQSLPNDSCCQASKRCKLWNRNGAFHKVIHPEFSFVTKKASRNGIGAFFYACGWRETHVCMCFFMINSQVRSLHQRVEKTKEDLQEQHERSQKSFDRNIPVRLDRQRTLSQVCSSQVTSQSQSDCARRRAQLGQQRIRNTRLNLFIPRLHVTVCKRHKRTWEQKDCSFQ